MGDSATSPSQQEHVISVMVVQPDDTVTIACKLAASPKQPQAQVRVASPACNHLSLRDVSEHCLWLCLCHHVVQMLYKLDGVMSQNASGGIEIIPFVLMLRRYRSGGDSLLLHNSTVSTGERHK